MKGLTKRIKLIQPGWGSSGYYPAEVLERDGSNAFALGTRMLDTHINANPENDASRQGESLYDLMSISASEAVYLDDPADGPGLYADFYFFEKVVDALGEDRIDASEFSIFAAVTMGEDQEIDGKTGPVIEALHAAPINSVDAVVRGGAGGRIATIQENASGETQNVVELGVSAVKAISEKQKTGRPVISREAVKRVIENHQNGENKQGAEIEGEPEQETQDNKMTLEEALEQIEALNAKLEAAQGELQSAKTKIDETSSNKDKLETRLANTESVLRELMTEKAILDALFGIEFINDEVREMVVEKVGKSIEWVSGKINKEKLDAAVATYKDGTSKLVAVEKATDEYAGYTYQRESYDYPAGGRAADAIEDNDDLVKEAMAQLEGMKFSRS